jgi:hypothetical protein
VLTVCGYLIIFESALTAMWFANHLSTFNVYRGTALAVVLARAAVGVLQFAGGWMLINERPPGFLFARVAMALSAILFVCEAGLRWGPTNLDPSLRWYAVLAYGLYAAAIVALMTRAARARSSAGRF